MGRGGGCEVVALPGDSQCVEAWSWCVETQRWGGGVESGCVGPEQGFGDLELPGQGTLFLFTSGNVASQVYSKHSGAGL